MTTSPEKAKEIADAIGARVVDDPIAAINDPEVDAVLIASPGRGARRAGERLSRRGQAGALREAADHRHRLVAYAIVEKEKALGTPLIQVGFMRRFDNEYAALKQLIVSGGLGNPLMVHCTHRNPTVPEHFNSEFMIRDSVVHEVDVAPVPAR